MKINYRTIVVLLFFSAFMVTCIDPYTPHLDNFRSLLVVDALITDKSGPNYVYLSRTKEKSGDTVTMVTGADVRITDDLKNEIILRETGSGIYETDGDSFRGEAGRTYTLHIKTGTGEEYVSDPCTLYPLQPIDSVYYRKDRESVNTEMQDGIRVFIDSKGESGCRYYRWTYEEWWKIIVPAPKLYDYLDGAFIKREVVNDTCWGHSFSQKVLIHATDDPISEPLLFIDSDKTSRLLIQYFIKINQYSVSKEEYEYWNLLKMVDESGGDIFDRQPFHVPGNIRNTNNSEEKVLGYFMVSSTDSDSIYISSKRVKGMGLPEYEYPCSIITVGPSDFAGSNPVPTIGDIYGMYTSMNLFFIAPVYGGPTVEQLIFATPLCADCTISGTPVKPAFWVDL